MASGASIRAGEAYVEGTFRDGKLVSGLRSGQAKMSAFGASVKAIGLQVAAAGAAITAPLLLSLNTYRKVGAELDDMAKRTGASVTALSELRYAASQSGTELSAVEGALRTMQKALLSAEQGGTKAADTLAQLGLSLGDLRDLSADQQFAAIARQLNAIEDPGLKAAMAMKIFGKSGQSLVPLIADLEALTRQANELGVVMTPEAAAKAAALDDALDTLNKTFEGTRAAIGAAVAPLATDFLAAITAVAAQMTHWVQSNNDAVASVAALGAGLVATGSALSVFAGAFHVVVLAIEDAIKAKKAFDVVMMAGAAPLAVALGAVATVLATIVMATMDWWKQQNRVNAAIDAAAQQRTSGGSEDLNNKVSRYEQLARKGTKLTKPELDEARGLAAEMRLEFGIRDSFSSSAGGFTNGARDMAQINAARTRRSDGALRDEIAFRRHEMDVAARRRQAERESSGLFRSPEIAELTKARDAEFAAAQAKRQAEIDKLVAQQQETARFIATAGETAGTPASVNLNANTDAAKQKAKDLADAQEQIEDELAQARIEAMKDGLAKELAMIDQREKEVLRELEQNGVFSGAALAAARGKVGQRFDMERDGARARDAEDKGEEAVQQAERRAREMDRIDDELAKARIATMEDGLEKELALIKQREREALRDLERSDVLTEREKDRARAKIEQTAELERQIAERGSSTTSVASAGTFHGALAEQQLGSQSATEEHLRWIREYSKRTAERAENGDGGIVLR